MGGGDIYRIIPELLASLEEHQREQRAQTP